MQQSRNAVPDPPYTRNIHLRGVPDAQVETKTWFSIYLGPLIGCEAAEGRLEKAHSNAVG
jgi:hypothetical protein